MREINGRESQMMIIDHFIDWLLSSVVPLVFFSYLKVYPVCFLSLPLACLHLSFFSSFSENDMEVQTGRCGHLQNERET